MIRKVWFSGDNCKTWEECKEWAKMRLESRNALELEEEPDDHHPAYLKDPNSPYKKIRWQDGSEAWDKLAMDGWAYVNKLPETEEDPFGGSEAWSIWIDRHEKEYLADAYKGSEFDEIVLGVAREKAYRLNIMADFNDENGDEEEE